jgi:hypothetical protein
MEVIGTRLVGFLLPVRFLHVKTFRLSNSSLSSYGTN